MRQRMGGKGSGVGLLRCVGMDDVALEGVFDSDERSDPSSIGGSDPGGERGNDHGVDGRQTDAFGVANRAKAPAADTAFLKCAGEVSFECSFIISIIVISIIIISIICSIITNIIISIISSIISTIIRVAFLLALRSFVGGVQG